MTRRLILVLLLGPCAVAVGIGAEAARFAWDEPVLWLPDLLVGWAMVACGLIAIWRRPSGTGPLLVGAGFTWFLGNFAALDSPLLAWLAAHAVYLHRGVLIHAVLAFPGWRPPTAVRSCSCRHWLCFVTHRAGRPKRRCRLSRQRNHDCGGVVGPSGRSRTLPPDSGDRSPSGRLARGRVERRCAGAAHGATGPTAGRAGPVGRTQVALIALAVGLLVALLLSSWERTGVTDLVTELAVGRASSVDASLARALGDPTLQVGYWVPERGGYVDAAGQEVDLPGPESGRAVTPVESEGTRIAVLIHDPAVAASAGLGESVSMAAGLGSGQRPLAGASTRSARPGPGI